MYFPLLNPLILVQSRVLREIQPLSMPIHVSPSASSAQASLWERQICPRSKPSAPEPPHTTAGRDLPPGTAELQGCAGTSRCRSLCPPPICLGTEALRWPEPTGSLENAEPSTEPLAPALLCAHGEAAASAAQLGFPQLGGAQRVWGLWETLGASSQGQAPSPHTAMFGSFPRPWPGTPGRQLGRDCASTEDPDGPTLC